MPPRPAELKQYRLAVYVAYGLVCGLVFFILLRSVIGDLYGRGGASPVPASPLACLDDLDRLYAQLSARAMQPASRGLDSTPLAREWDQWSGRWQDELEAVARRCHLDDATDGAQRDLANARESLDDLRRELSRSGESASQEARRVKDSLASARARLLSPTPK